MVKTTASNREEKSMLCNRSVTWWDEEVKEAVRVRTKSHAIYTPCTTAIGWEGYAMI